MVPRRPAGGAFFVHLCTFDILYLKPDMSCLFHLKLGFDEYCMKKNPLAKRLTFTAALLPRLKCCQVLRVYQGTQPNRSRKTEAAEIFN